MSIHSRITARRMSIVQALEWAFATEFAQLDFDELGAHEFDRGGVVPTLVGNEVLLIQQGGIDPTWLIARRAELGCTVDGGGSSDPHHDAQIIAAAVETLPIGCGGRRMAIHIAELARARRAPDWGQGIRMACVPADPMEMCEAGLFLRAAVRKDARSWVYRDKWRKQQRAGYCAVTYTGTAASIAAAHRNYLAWCGALIDLHARLKGALLSIEITDDFPDYTPWRGEK